MTGSLTIENTPADRARAAIRDHGGAINAVLALVDPALGEGAGPAIDSPLAGQAVLIKDCMDLAGHPTTHGSAVHADAAPATADATVVARLRAAGMAIVGKAHLTEFCFGATGENAHFGDCRNPWDTDRITGGSSSGSAAAVAAGLVRYALGTDTGGSVRVPAALCGVVGLRPTIGAVSNHGVLHVSTICDTVGPIAPTVREAAELFHVIAGFDPADPLSIPDNPRDPRALIGQSLEGMRIAMPTTFYGEGLAPAVADAIADAARTLESLGATVVPITLSEPEALREMRTFRFVLADVADARRDLVASPDTPIGSEVRRRIELGMEISGVDYAASIRAVWRRKAELRTLFAESFDAMLTPTTPVTAPLWTDSRDMVATTRLVGRMTYDLGATGVPSLSVPCGFDELGLPIGMQLSAAWGREDTLFRIGHAFEQATAFHTRHPAAFSKLFE